MTYRAKDNSSASVNTYGELPYTFSFISAILRILVSVAGSLLMPSLHRDAKEDAPTLGLTLKWGLQQAKWPYSTVAAKED